MTMYRVGPAGIPASLKSDMNTVLNKKFGTTGQDYPPAGWPEDVNLLGPLPEKTASGSVASITDGADGVPIKNWGVTVDATLDGVSSVVCTQAGKNLLPYGNADTDTINQVSFSVDGEGRFAVSGTASGGSATFYNPLANTYTIQAGDYLHLMNSAAVANVSVGLRENNTGIVAPACSPANRIFNLSSYAGRTITQVSVYVPNGGTYEGTITPMIIHGNTATTFEKYTAPTVTTVSLGRTIYGGSVDVVNGTGTDENGNDFTFTPITPTPETPLGASNFWADAGDSAVTYRADISMLLNP